MKTRLCLKLESLKVLRIGLNADFQVLSNSLTFLYQAMIKQSSKQKQPTNNDNHNREHKVKQEIHNYENSSKGLTHSAEEKV